MQKVQIKTEDFYKLINHGPVVLISTLYKKKYNVTPIAWIMPLDFNPPKLLAIMSDENYSYECIEKTKEFVVNIPDKKLLKQVLYCGSVSGRNVDKIEKTKFKLFDAKRVKAPIIGDCIAHIECRLTNKKVFSPKDNILMADVLAAYVNKGLFKETLDIKKAKTLHHLGGTKFCTIRSL